MKTNRINSECKWVRVFLNSFILFIIFIPPVALVNFVVQNILFVHTKVYNEVNNNNSNDEDACIDHVENKFFWHGLLIISNQGTNKECSSDKDGKDPGDDGENVKTFEIGLLVAWFFDVRKHPHQG